MKIFLFLLICLVVLGQLLRIPFGDGGAILPNDFLVPTILLIWVLVRLKNKSFIIHKTPLNLPIVIFLIILFFSLLLNLSNFFGVERLTSLAYLLRYASYALIFFLVLDVINQKQDFYWLFNILIFAGLIFALLGFLQLIFVPNFEFMTQYGWDPHAKRLLSTFFDPNYAGGFLVFINSIILARMLFTQNKAEKGLWFFAFLFLLLAIVLTYSRSTYLAFAISVLAIGILKSWRLLLFGVLILVIAFFAFPRMQERILGGFSLDVTTKMRLDSYKQAQKIIEDSPILGVGYNNLRVVREEYGQALDPKQMTAGGFDSSFLTILATTGIVGLIAYLWLIWRILRESFQEFWNKKSEPVLRGLGLGIFAGFCGLIVHSQFVNSLLYPHIMVYLWFLLGLFWAGRRICEKNLNL